MAIRRRRDRRDETLGHSGNAFSRAAWLGRGASRPMRALLVKTRSRALVSPSNQTAPAREQCQCQTRAQCATIPDICNQGFYLINLCGEGQPSPDPRRKILSILLGGGRQTDMSVTDFTPSPPTRPRSLERRRSYARDRRRSWIETPAKEPKPLGSRRFTSGMPIVSQAARQCCRSASFTRRHFFLEQKGAIQPALSR